MLTPSSARAPRRERGQVRVATIMEAGAALFREKGFDAVTMSDIAARSGTAFGSLYRFFPSKESLADALLQQYAQQALDQLRGIAEQAPDMGGSGVADALVEFMLGLQAERSFAIAVIEARGGGGDRQAQFRKALRDGVAAILRRAWPDLTAANAKALAVMALHVLKGVAATADEPPAARRLLLGHYRGLLGAYFSSMHGATVPAPRRNAGSRS
jgi:AcrR family transcriptional regulator